MAFELIFIFNLVNGLNPGRSYHRTVIMIIVNPEKFLEFQKSLGVSCFKIGPQKVLIIGRKRT